MSLWGVFEKMASFYVFWKGKPGAGDKESGVGFALGFCLVEKKFNLAYGVSVRIMIFFIAHVRLVTIISTLASGCPFSVSSGDFNARVHRGNLVCP